MTQFSDDDIRHIAKLSALAINEEEVKQFREDLNSIGSLIDHLSSVITRGIIPTFNVHGASAIYEDSQALRGDFVEDSLPLQEVARNAPSFEHKGFKVPRIL